jgi:hypothetical protein
MHQHGGIGIIGFYHIQGEGSYEGLVEAFYLWSY